MIYLKNKQPLNHLSKISISVMLLIFLIATSCSKKDPEPAKSAKLDPAKGIIGKWATKSVSSTDSDSELQEVISNSNKLYSSGLLIQDLEFKKDKTGFTKVVLQGKTISSISFNWKISKNIVTISYSGGAIVSSMTVVSVTTKEMIIDETKPMVQGSTKKYPVRFKFVKK